MEGNIEKKCNLALKSLKMIGYFDSQLLSKLYGIVFLVTDIVVFLGEIIAFLNRDTVQDRIEVLYTTNAVIFALFLYLITKNHQKVLHQFLSAITKSHSSDDDLQLQALRLTVNKVEKIIPKIAIIMLCFLTPISVGWCLIPFLTEVDYRNKNYSILPYLFQCTDNGDNRFPVKFLCTKRESLFEFILYNLLVTFFAFYSVFPILMWLFSFLVCMCIFVKANVTAIEVQLLPFNEKSSHTNRSLFQDSQVVEVENKSISYYNEEENLALKTQLIKVVQYHQYLYR